jgi:hypothetical protein
MAKVREPVKVWFDIERLLPQAEPEYAVGYAQLSR